MNCPLISIIIPALNEEKVIGKCLASLAAQNIDCHEFEVFVVDNGSQDSTIEIARGFQNQLNLSILSKSGNISAVRNFGAASAKGQFFAFLDADCCAPSGWLRRAIALMQSGDGGVIGGYHAIPPSSSWIAKSWWGDLAKTKKGAVSYIPSGTLLVSQHVFREIGGFDVGLETSEDFDLCHRAASAGYHVLAYPELSTVHLGTPQTFKAFYHQHNWHGSGVRTAFLANIFHPRFLKTFLLTLYTMFWTIVTLLSAPVAIMTKHALFLLVGPAFLLLGAVAMASRDAAMRQRLSLIPPLIPLYLVYGIARSLSFISVGDQRMPRTSGGSFVAPPIAKIGRH